MFPNVLIPPQMQNYSRFLSDSQDIFNLENLKSKTLTFDEVQSNSNSFLTSSSAFLMDNLLNSNLERNEPYRQKINKTSGSSSADNPQVKSLRQNDVRVCSPNSVSDSPSDYRMLFGPLSPNCETSYSQSPTDYTIRKESPNPLEPESPRDDRMSPINQDEMSRDSRHGGLGTQPDLEPGIDEKFNDGRWTPKRGK